jgi:hypothetical protein
MTRLLRSVALAVLGLVAASAAGEAAGSVQRFALVAGANDGGSRRTPLQYAVSDAASFARVVVELGGVSAENALVLEQPTISELERAFDDLRRRVTRARATVGGRTEVLVYYSGHADDQGLLLGEDRYSYRTLRDRLDDVPADVRIAVLDACASGAITRMKGGRVRQPFLVDESAEMRGHAFLTSSAETEGAQESDRIGASYFTHYLVSGLRGAADVSGEGKVTLNEAYQFAFNETLGGTVDTKGGAQHPSYDINLSGTGDVVMTDLRQTSAGLVLSPDLSGRCFVRNAEAQLVVELQKPEGRSVSLGLEPGEYTVHCDLKSGGTVASAKLVEGTRVELGPDRFAPTERQETALRGASPEPPGPRPLDGRSRFDLRATFSRQASVSTSSPVPPLATVQTSVEGFGGGIDYSLWLREDLALGVSAAGRAIDASISSGVAGSLIDSTTISSLLVGVRWYPGGRPTSSVRPHLTAMVGPYIGTGSSISSGLGGDVVETRVLAAPGAYLGAGVDFRVSGHFTIGIGAGADLPADFSEPLAGTKSYRGFQMNVTFGWVFGKGRSSSPRADRS